MKKLIFVFLSLLICQVGWADEKSYTRLHIYGNSYDESTEKLDKEFDIIYEILTNLESRIEKLEKEMEEKYEESDFPRIGIVGYNDTKQPR